MSWSFSPETMYFGSGPTLVGHQSARVIDGKMEDAPSLFWREMTVSVSAGKRRETTVRVE